MYLIVFHFFWACCAISLLRACYTSPGNPPKGELAIDSVDSASVPLRNMMPGSQRLHSNQQQHQQPADRHFYPEFDANANTRADDVSHTINMNINNSGVNNVTATSTTSSPFAGQSSPYVSPFAAAGSSNSLPASSPPSPMTQEAMAQNSWPSIPFRRDHSSGAGAASSQSQYPLQGNETGSSLPAGAGASGMQMSSGVFRPMLTEPRRSLMVPLDQKLTADLGAVTVKRNGSARVCQKCKILKPDRTHHCSMCGE